MHRARALAALLLVTAACNRQKATGPTVQTAPVTRQDIVVDVEATGVIQPINAVQVRSKASGQIIKMPVSTGSQVKPGDLLVQIDPRDVQSRYDEASAALKAAQANLEVSDTQYKRNQELFDERVITAPELEAARLTSANAQSQLATARTNLDVAKIALEDATIRAPIAGTVLDKEVSLGQVIASSTASYGGGTTLLTMADLTDIMDSTLVNESDVGSVKPGQQATITVDAYPNRVFKGTVLKVAPQATVQQSVTMFPVVIKLDNHEGLLMPGMNSDVSILVQSRENALAVPNDAVRTPRDVPLAASAIGLDPVAVRKEIQEQFAKLSPRGRPGDTAAAAGVLLAATPGDSGRRSGTAAGGHRSRDTSASDTSARRLRGGATDLGPAGGGKMARPGLVFVQQGTTFAPRVVTLGIANYDNTEVLSGVKEGERVAMVSAAMLQQKRGQQQERVRNLTALPGTQSAPSSSSGASRGGGGTGGGGNRGP